MAKQNFTQVSFISLQNAIYFQMNVKLFLAMNISELTDMSKYQMWNTTEGYDGIVISRLIKISEVTIPAGAYPLACFGTGLIVFLFVTWHLFNDMSTHFALERDLMFNLSYEILFQGANLMLNRRRIDRSLKRDNREGQTDPYIFICTTLWQENKQEMETLLRSLVRLSSHLGRVFKMCSVYRRRFYFE